MSKLSKAIAGVLMRIIGLTGGIASGKSTVSGIIKSMGYPVIDADEIAIHLAEPGHAIWMAYRDRYGQQVLNDDGTLNRQAVANIVFSDKKELAWANSMSHPVIRQKLEEELRTLEKKGTNMVFLDIPLLIEAGFDIMSDAVWLVYISSELQLRRLIERNGYSIAEAKRRISAQMSLEEKRQYADVIIDNSGTLEDLRSCIVKELENEPR